MHTMLIKVKKELYDEKEILRYQLVRVQKPNWKEESKGMIKRIGSYLRKAGEC